MVENKGPEFFGFSHPTIQNLIQSCPGARKCTSYEWQKFEVIKESTERPAETHTAPPDSHVTPVDCHAAPMDTSTPTTGSSLRSTDQSLLDIPRVNFERFGRRAFSCASPSLWNSLPLVL